MSIGDHEDHTRKQMVQTPAPRRNEENENDTPHLRHWLTQGHNNTGVLLVANPGGYLSADAVVCRLGAHAVVATTFGQLIKPKTVPEALQLLDKILASQAAAMLGAG